MDKRPSSQRDRSARGESRASLNPSRILITAQSRDSGSKREDIASRDTTSRRISDASDHSQLSHYPARSRYDTTGQGSSPSRSFRAQTTYDAAQRNSTVKTSGRSSKNVTGNDLLLLANEVRTLRVRGGLLEIQRRSIGLENLPIEEQVEINNRANELSEESRKAYKELEILQEKSMKDESVSESK
jgi:hypothetical protein